MTYDKDGKTILTNFKISNSNILIGQNFRGINFKTIIKFCNVSWSSNCSDCWN